ncbi:MAG TPA: hypothetical protein VJ986_05710 [Gaiellaceae bacterium]|nr:hypothetical protein [Gaiellaceae bacterium]
MSIATLPRTAPGQADLQGRLQDELHHIRDLVFLRGLLAERGATEADLEECDAVIDAARAQLAEAAKDASTRYATAA